MLGEIIAIGDELTSGRIANTTSGFAARRLFDAGHEIFAMHTIGDTPTLIGEALKRAIGRVDFVIVTGGLGHTNDDLTNEAVTIALNRPPVVNQKLLAKITAIGHLPPGVSPEKMATLPQDAEILSARSRMAGHLLVHDNVPIFFLPGVPLQMQELLIDQVLPRLARWSSEENSRQRVHQRIFKVFGLGELEINRRLQQLEKQEHVKIGYYPVDSEVHVSLTVLAPADIESSALFRKNCKKIKKLLGTTIFAHDQETMASVVGLLLTENDFRLGTAESCTGGLIASKITEIPGSSAWFNGSVVAYANLVKQELLHVDAELIDDQGAVSEEVARAMARGLIEDKLCDIALSATGIAGPDGGSPEKPVGTVYIGLATKETVYAKLFHFLGNRRQIQEQTAQTALNIVRYQLLNIEGETYGPE